MINILITGGSHTGALNHGLRRMPPSRNEHFSFSILPLGGGITLAGRFFENYENRIEITDLRYRQNLAQIPPPEFRCDTVGFSTALYSRPIWFYKSWAKYGLGREANGRIPISRALLNRLILDDVRHVLAFLEALKALGLNPFVIEGPRPFRHNNEINAVGEGTVMYIDLCYRSAVNLMLQDREIPVVQLPKTTYDPDGYMMEKYRSERLEDKTHANGDFGLIMIKEIVLFLKGAKMSQ